jgi:hypothetical protein
MSRPNVRLTSNGDYSQWTIDLVLTCTMCLLAVAGWLSYMGFDKDALFIEALKVLVPLAIGGIGGFYYGRGHTITGK